MSRVNNKNTKTLNIFHTFFLMFLLEHILHQFPMFLLLTLIKQMLLSPTLSIYKRWNYSGTEVLLLESLVKSLEKQTLEKKWSETLLKIISYVAISGQTVMFRTHILSCVSNSKYGYIDIKTIYREKPKDRNIEIE